MKGLSVTEKQQKKTPHTYYKKTQKINIFAHVDFCNKATTTVWNITNNSK